MHPLPVVPFSKISGAASYDQINCVSKNEHLFRFCYNFVSHKILVIFGNLVAKEIRSRTMRTLLTGFK